MTITRVHAWHEFLPLSRPYTIASKSVDAVALFFVRLEAADGTVGLGAASPTEDITGESDAACAAALAETGPALLEGRDVRRVGSLLRSLAEPLRATPAARAALDMAVYDLFTRHLGIPLADYLGRCHDALPTSITIGIMPTDEAIAEADEYIERGFRCLKVKLGHDAEEDAERLHRLRERVGPDVLMRVDANQGYSVAETLRMEALVEALDLEFVEQPLPAGMEDDLRTLPETLRRRIAADESLHAEADALALSRAPAACGIFNIKLMKCGGITAALRIAEVADLTGLSLMWGCMDESRISIAAALHAAFACPATRYLDLDGHLDLSRDLADGGFTLRDGALALTDRPGLGVHLTGS